MGGEVHAAAGAARCRIRATARRQATASGETKVTRTGIYLGCVRRDGHTRRLSTIAPLARRRPGRPPGRRPSQRRITVLATLVVASGNGRELRGSTWIDSTMFSSSARTSAEVPVWTEASITSGTPPRSRIHSCWS